MDRRFARSRSSARYSSRSRIAFAYFTTRSSAFWFSLYRATPRLGNTQSIPCVFCFICRKICLRNPHTPIVRYCHRDHFVLRSVRASRASFRCCTSCKTFRLLAGRLYVLSASSLCLRVHQSSSSRAERPSASSTQDGSYFAFFIGIPHFGHVRYALLQIVLHAEQINASARNR